MSKRGYLVLEDGTVFAGEVFGAETSTYGEVVFNTSMTGYQEMLTDPSYAGQILVPTYPLQGNYGVNRGDFESRRIQVAGFVVRQWCPYPSHPRAEMTLDEFLKAYGVPGLAGVDTRALTRRLRTRGVMMGILACDEAPESALARLREVPPYGNVDFVQQVTTRAPSAWPALGEERWHIVAFDCGLKYNIMRLLNRRGCRVTVVPATSTAEEVLALRPHGVVFSPGPGDPALLDGVVDTAKRLVGRTPILGICLGHQVLARAFGGRTFKLKFGHRGGNHPVRDLTTGRVYITAQNHGYAVDADSLPPDLEVTHINLNDGTVEGLRHRSLPILTIQYHSEASPGPWDNEYLFDRFLEMMHILADRGTAGYAGHP